MSCNGITLPSATPATLPIVLRGKEDKEGKRKVGEERRGKKVASTSISPLALSRISAIFIPVTYRERYYAYLSSSAWHSKRGGILDRDNHRCVICGSTEDLQVHHLTYDRVFNEHPNDLMTLCDYHHDQIEEFVAAGRILRTGNVGDLAAKTVRLLGGALELPAMAPKAFKAAKQERNRAISEQIMNAPGFNKARKLSRSKFWAWFLKTFDGNPQVLRRHSLAWHLKVRPQGKSEPPVSMERLHKTGRAVRLTNSIIKMFARKKNCINKQQLVALGIGWPPMHGWHKKIHRMFVSAEMIEKLQSLRH